MFSLSLSLMVHTSINLSIYWTHIFSYLWCFPLFVDASSQPIVQFHKRLLNLTDGSNVTSVKAYLTIPKLPSEEDSFLNTLGIMSSKSGRYVCCGDCCLNIVYLWICEWFDFERTDTQSTTDNISTVYLNFESCIADSKWQKWLEVQMKVKIHYV